MKRKLRAKRKGKPGAWRHIGRCMETARQALDITRYQAAKRMGVSRTAWNNWERGMHIPNAPSLLAIAAVLHVSVEFLIAGESSTPLSIAAGNSLQSSQTDGKSNLPAAPNQSKEV